MVSTFKHLAFKAGGLVLRVVPPSVVVRILSGVNKGFRWVRGAAHMPEWLGIYEPEQQALLRAQVKPGMVVYDIGANAGFFTLACSRLAGPTGRVLAFEPQPGNAAKIVRHLRLNNLANASLIQAAVGRQAGLCSFDAGPDDYQGRLVKGASWLQVPVIGLDEFIATGQPVPDLIKMDIEGGESEALCGALNLLRGRRPLLILSVHGDEQDRLCAELLRREGYQFDYFGNTSGLNKDLLARPMSGGSAC